MSIWFILASGPSLVRTWDPQLVRKGCRVMTINSSWEICPWADIHYSNDFDWWEHNLPKMDEARGQFMCGHPTVKVPGVDNSYKFDKKARGLARGKGRLVWGGNSGYAGINLATQLGAQKIYLFGYDMRGTHWHPEHPEEIRKPPNFKMWKERYFDMAVAARRMGVEIYNCSDNTSLTCFRHVQPARIFK